MKTKKLILITLLMLCTGVVKAENLHEMSLNQREEVKVNLGWSDFNYKTLALLMFGKRENGKAVSKFFPSKENGNEREAIIYSAGVLVWYGGQNGNEYFNYTIKGKRLELYNTKTGKLHNRLLLEGVVKKLPEGSYELFTIDDQGWYRWFFVNPF